MFSENISEFNGLKLLRMSIFEAYFIISLSGWLKIGLISEPESPITNLLINGKSSSSPFSNFSYSKVSESTYFNSMLPPVSSSLSMMSIGLLLFSVVLCGPVK